jgi:hypothetical protein
LADTFDGSDCLLGDFTDQGEAVQEATARARPMLSCYVYDDTGKLVFSDR